MHTTFYDSPEWKTLRERVLTRDGRRCTVARLLGGPCRGALHVHHIEPVEDRPDLALDEDNCGTACASHHPKWEALRRQLVKRRGWRTCKHPHRTAEARRICEARLNRDQAQPLAA